MDHMLKSVKAFAPATIANVICGFDILSLAIEGAGDTVELTLNNRGKHEIVSMENGDGLPFEIENNVCSGVILAMQEKIDSNNFYDIAIVKGFSAGSGLGSSAASAVAAAVAYNEIEGCLFDDDEMIEFARLGEVIACGSPIADNVAAAVLGGLSMINSLSPLKVTQLPIPKDIFIHALFPQITVKTSESRALMPDTIKMTTSVEQSMALGSFIASLYTEDLELMKASLQDHLAEPYRSSLIPNYDQMKKAALDNGALGFGISGSGPTVFSMVHGKENLEKVSKAVISVFEGTGIEYQSYQSALGGKGASIVY